MEASGNMYIWRPLKKRNCKNLNDSTNILACSCLVSINFWHLHASIQSVVKIPSFCQFVDKWEPFKDNYVKSVSITTSHFCFTSHINVHISACSWPILLKFWCKHIYSELSNQWWKPHLSLSTCLEIGACQRHYYQARNDHHEVKSPPPHFWVENEKSATRFFFCWFSAIQGTHREWNMEKLEEGTFAVLESPRYEAWVVYVSSASSQQTTR